MSKTTRMILVIVAFALIAVMGVFVNLLMGASERKKELVASMVPPHTYEINASGVPAPETPVDGRVDIEGLDEPQSFVLSFSECVQSSIKFDAGNRASKHNPVVSIQLEYEESESTTHATLFKTSGNIEFDRAVLSAASVCGASIGRDIKSPLTVQYRMYR